MFPAAASEPEGQVDRDDHPQGDEPRGDGATTVTVVAAHRGAPDQQSRSTDTEENPATTHGSTVYPAGTHEYRMGVAGECTQ